MVVADDVLQAVAQIELGLEVLVLFQHLALVQGPLDRHFQLFVDQRLGEEIEGSRADRLDRRVHRAVAGDHDHRRGRLLLPAVGQHVEAVAVRLGGCRPGPRRSPCGPRAAIPSARLEAVSTW